MFITGLGTATPPHRYTQAQCWEAFRCAPQFAQLDRRARATLQNVLLRANGIRTRTLALASLAEAFETDADTLHRRFAVHAPALAAEAAAAALGNAGLRARAVDAVIVSSCTGYLCPGLSSHVAERLGLRADVLALDLVGQGCGAALPNLRTAEALLRARRGNTVLSVCVEVCSAAFYMDNDPGVLISACLFADGAGAAVLCAAPHPARRRVAWNSAYSLHDPDQREALRFEQRAGMLRNILTPQVPALAAQHAGIVLGRALRDAGISRADISAWVWHPGGPRVLDALQDALALTPADVALSRRVLSEYGNLSSPSVYFVLRDTLRADAAPGWWWMSAFGAGFSCHGALLEVA